MAGIAGLPKANAGVRLRRLGAMIWLAYAPLVALVLAYSVAAAILLDEFDAQISFGLVQLFVHAKLMVVALAVCGAAFGYLALLKRTDARASARVARWLRRTPFLEIALIRFLPVVILIVPFQQTYLAVKRQIPELVPYSWDMAFVRLDRLLFLGEDPWAVTHWLIPWAGATWGMNLAYILWFYLLMASTAAAAVLRLDSRLRMTYLLAYFLSWSVGGSLLAAIFSSAGPVYVERLFGDATFAPLMQRLASQSESWPLLALNAQEQLWQGLVDPAVPAMGISAFPSMHLCIATGMMLLGFSFGRVIGWLLAAFTGVMLVASVHLGWHYAADGVAGIGLGLLFWHVSARFAAWWFDRAERRAADAVTEGCVKEDAVTKGRLGAAP